MDMEEQCYKIEVEKLRKENKEMRDFINKVKGFFITDEKNLITFNEDIVRDYVRRLNDKRGY